MRASILLPLAAFVVADDVLWVHSPPSLSIAVSSATGMPVHFNASAEAGGFASGLAALSWLGEAPATTLALSVAPCGLSAVCVNRTLRVIGQWPNASCCAPYIVAATDVFQAVPAPAPGLPSSVAWTFAVVDTIAEVPWRTRITTDVSFAS